MATTVEELMQQCVTVSTVQQYENFVQAHNILSVREEIPEGGSALWFGSPSAKRVIAHVHGGGLVLYASTFHFALAYDMYKAAISKDPDTAVAILSYDTSPSGAYPIQLRQLVAFVTYLMRARDARNIDLYGDSVGGILILALLLHITHQHPKVPLLSIPSGDSFGRVLLISPSPPMVTPTMEASKNIGRDIVGLEEIAQMWSAIKSNCDPEIDLVNPWFTPVSSMREEWYENLPAETITIVSGGLEIFEEDIRKLSQVIEAKNQGRVGVYVDETVGHIAFLTERMMNSPPSEYTRRVVEWASI